MSLTSIFQDIADAIRAKTGKVDTMTPAEMPTEIASISTGSGIPVEYIKLNVTENAQVTNYGDSLVYGVQNTAHYIGINSLDLTTYTDYSTYLSYDQATSKFTVLADFTGFFRGWVENYQSSGTPPRGTLFYNDTEILSYVADGNSQGARGGDSTEVECKAGDTFYVTTPTDNGWAKQYIKVYKEN